MAIGSFLKMLLQGQHICVKFCYNMETAKEMTLLLSERKSESFPRLNKLNNRSYGKTMSIVL